VRGSLLNQLPQYLGQRLDCLDAARGLARGQQHLVTTPRAASCLDLGPELLALPACLIALAAPLKSFSKNGNKAIGFFARGEFPSVVLSIQ